MSFPLPDWVSRAIARAMADGGSHVIMINSDGTRATLYIDGKRITERDAFPGLETK